MNLVSNVNPVKIIQSEDWATTCSSQLEELGIDNPIIISSRGTAERNRVAKQFSGFDLFPDVLPNPTTKSCQRVVDLVHANKYDGVIAIGGGSVMDTAKCAMAALGTRANKLNDLLTWEGPYPYAVPSVFIPTTHGTASEVTMWGTLWDLDEQKKLSIVHQSLYPTVAILDGTLCLSLPLDISLITALDALSHSFESIWNKNANGDATQIAIDAICQILDNLPRLEINRDDLAVRNNLLEAATGAGLAFSQTKTAAAHSISYPLTLHYNIPHGIASSITLAPLLDINGDSIRPSLEIILGRLGLASTSDLKSSISNVASRVLRYSLSEWDVKRDEIPSLVEQSFTKGRMDNNIVDLQKSDVQNILESIY